VGSACGVQVEHTTAGEHQERGEGEEAAAGSASKQQASSEFGVDGRVGHGSASVVVLHSIKTAAARARAVVAGLAAVYCLNLKRQISA